MRVLFFAHLKTITHCSEMNLECQTALSTEELWGEIIARHPELEKFRGSVRLARNSEYVSADAHYACGDEVALIPPVSGG